MFIRTPKVKMYHVVPAHVMPTIMTVIASSEKLHAHQVTGKGLRREARGKVQVYKAAVIMEQALFFDHLISRRKTGTS